MTKRTPDFHAYPAWTRAKFWSFIRSALRQAWNRWPPKYEVLNEARTKYTGKDKRRKWSYKCTSCGKYFPSSEVEVDHIEEVGQLRDYIDLPQFVSRLFCSRDKLQVLCKPCHRDKPK